MNSIHSLLFIGILLSMTSRSLAQTPGTPIDYLPSGLELVGLYRVVDDSTKLEVLFKVDSFYTSNHDSLSFQVCLENHMNDSAFSASYTKDLSYLDTMNSGGINYSYHVRQEIRIYHDYHLHELVYDSNVVTRFNHANKSPHIFEDWENRYPRYTCIKALGPYSAVYEVVNAENIAYQYFGSLNTGYPGVLSHFGTHPVGLYNSHPSLLFPWGYADYAKFQEYTEYPAGNLLNATICETTINDFGVSGVFFENTPVASTFVDEIANINPSGTDMLYSIEYYKRELLVPSFSDSIVRIGGLVKPEFGPYPWYAVATQRAGDFTFFDELIFDPDTISATYEYLVTPEDSLLFVILFHPHHFSDNLKYCPYVADSVCLIDGFEINGEMVYEEGLYYDSLLTAWGTDSILARQLYLKIPDVMDTLETTFCTGDTFYFYGHAFVDSGTYYLDTTQSLLCDTGLLLRLSEEDLTTGVSYDLSNYTVYTEENNGTADYQWYREDGTPISGATSNGYAVTENGAFYCVITGEFCTFTTEVVSSYGVGVEEWEPSQIVLYPNPVEQVLHIDTKEGIEEIVLYNTVGELVYSRNTPTQSIDMSTLSRGMYTVQIKLSSGILVHRKMIKM